MMDEGHAAKKTALPVSIRKAIRPLGIALDRGHRHAGLIL
jgi:hypothetical protein